MAVIEQLREKKDFTGVECDIADYVLAHLEEVTSLKISELAERTYSSNATIVRFCRKLGLKGYRDFRIVLSREYEKSLHEHHTVDVDMPVLPNQEMASIMSNIATLTKEAVDTCYSSLSTTDLRRAALAIMRAQHVYLYARGDSRISTLLFANQLMKLGIHCIDALRFGEGPAYASMASNRDVALVVSYSGSMLNYMKNDLDILVQSGCKVVFVSSAEKPKGAWLGIRFPHYEAEEAKVATYYSQACIRYILNCIYAEVFALGDSESIRRKVDVDAATYSDAWPER